MSLKAKIIALAFKVENVNEAILHINIRAAELNGVAVTIPDSAPPPAHFFRGHKVILSNVMYSRAAGCIKASFKLPYCNPEDNGRKYAAFTTRCAIDEEWFND